MPSLDKQVRGRSRLAQKNLGINTRARIVEYLRARQGEEAPVLPSYREIMVACGISSTSVVNYHLAQLERAGLIIRHGNLARSVRLVAAPREVEPLLDDMLTEVREILLTYWVKTGNAGLHTHWLRRAVATDELPRLAQAVVNHAARTLVRRDAHE